MSLFPYESILNLPHPVSENHPRMPRVARAAQFAPFAALTGYGELVAEEARLTDREEEPDESELELLDRKLLRLLNQLRENGPDSLPAITVKYFVPDSRKEGGTYRCYTGRLKRLEEYHRLLVFQDGTKLPLDRVRSLEAGAEDPVESV